MYEECEHVTFVTFISYCLYHENLNVVFEILEKSQHFLVYKFISCSNLLVVH